jgi:hypothetical protein
MSGKMRAAVLTAWVLLASACTSTSGEQEAGRIMIVNGLGSPVQGAVIMPDEEDSRGAVPRRLADEDRQARTSDAQGIIHADLEQYFWDSDGCYHFRIRRGGFEDVTMTVSRDLFPPLLRIRLEASPPKAGRSPDAGSPPAASPAGREPRQP